MKKLLSILMFSGAILFAGCSGGGATSGEQSSGNQNQVPSAPEKPEIEFVGSDTNSYGYAVSNHKLYIKNTDATNYGQYKLYLADYYGSSANSAPLTLQWDNTRGLAYASLYTECSDEIQYAQLSRVENGMESTRSEPTKFYCFTRPPFIEAKGNGEDNSVFYYTGTNNSEFTMSPIGSSPYLNYYDNGSSTSGDIEFRIYWGDTPGFTPDEAKSVAIQVNKKQNYTATHLNALYDENQIPKDRYYKAVFKSQTFNGRSGYSNETNVLGSLMRFMVKYKYNSYTETKSLRATTFQTATGVFNLMENYVPNASKESSDGTVHICKTSPSKTTVAGKSLVVDATSFYFLDTYSKLYKGPIPSESNHGKTCSITELANLSSAYPHTILSDAHHILAVSNDKITAISKTSGSVDAVTGKTNLKAVVVANAASEEYVVFADSTGIYRMKINGNLSFATVETVTTTYKNASQLTVAGSKVYFIALDSSSQNVIVELDPFNGTTSVIKSGLYFMDIAVNGNYVFWQSVSLTYMYNTSDQSLKSINSSLKNIVVDANNNLWGQLTYDFGAGMNNLYKIPSSYFKTVPAPTNDYTLTATALDSTAIITTSGVYNADYLKVYVDDVFNGYVLSGSQTLSPSGGLNNGTTYTIKTIAANAAGEGTQSQTITVTPKIAAPTLSAITESTDDYGTMAVRFSLQGTLATNPKDRTLAFDFYSDTSETINTSGTAIASAHSISAVTTSATVSSPQNYAPAVDGTLHYFQAKVSDSGSSNVSAVASGSLYEKMALVGNMNYGYSS